MWLGSAGEVFGAGLGPWVCFLGLFEGGLGLGGGFFV